jgi:hypothetical protein
VPTFDGFAEAVGTPTVKETDGESVTYAVLDAVIVA